MRYWNKDLKARRTWAKFKIPPNILFDFLVDQVSWKPLKQTSTYKKLKHQLQQIPGPGRFYIDRDYIYFERTEDLLWFQLMYA